ncbi:MAG TPA: hypothetical protein VHO02_08975 [Fibrobacteria bacterium]|nr:hypothetical protein [Fibrobacteria bacterium]
MKATEPPAAPRPPLKGWSELVARVEGFGNVSEGCRSLGVDRSAYYRALRRLRASGEYPYRSPLAKPLDLEKKLIALCLEYPDWGCDRLAWYLTLKGDAISSPTAQKILIRHGLGRATERRTAAMWMGEEGVRAGFPLP